MSYNEQPISGAPGPTPLPNQIPRQQQQQQREIKPCYFCGTTKPEANVMFCSLCKHFFCDACRGKYPDRIRGMIEEKRAAFTQGVKKVFSKPSVTLHRDV